MWDRDLMRARRWAWLRGEIEGLVTRPPLTYVLKAVGDEHERWTPVWGTRVQRVVNE